MFSAIPKNPTSWFISQLLRLRSWKKHHHAVNEPFKPALNAYHNLHSRKSIRKSLPVAVKVEFNSICHQFRNWTYEGNSILSEFTCWFVETTSIQAHQKSIRFEFIHDLCTLNDKQTFSSNSNPIQNDGFSCQALEDFQKAGLLFSTPQAKVSSALLWYPAFRYTIHHKNFFGGWEILLSHSSISVIAVDANRVERLNKLFLCGKWKVLIKTRKKRNHFLIYFRLRWGTSCTEWGNQEETSSMFKCLESLSAKKNLLNSSRHE